MPNASQEAKLTNGGRMLKRGDSFDIECGRTTHRLRVGQSLLRSQGIEPTWEHSDSTTVEFGRVKHVCDYRCKATWPEWVSDEVFDQAYAMANAIQDAKGAHAARQMNEAALARR